MAHPPAAHWPLFDLVIRTPRIEMRIPDDELLVELADLAADGVHAPDSMPFIVPWTRAEPPELQRNVLQYHWGVRSRLAREDWTLEFVTIVDGSVVGAQAIGAKSFAVVKEVHSGSWLGRIHQGQGIGKEMRSAILHLAFAGLGAEVATSAAHADNASSIGVSRALGYDDNGYDLSEVEGVVRKQLRFWMDRARWEERRREDISIEGLEPCLPLLGASAADEG